SRTPVLPGRARMCADDPIWSTKRPWPALRGSFGGQRASPPAHSAKERRTRPPDSSSLDGRRPRRHLAMAPSRQPRPGGTPSVRSYTSATTLDPGRAHPSGADLDERRAQQSADTKEAHPMSGPSPAVDPSASRATLRVGDQSYAYHRLDAAGAGDLARLPFTVKDLLENALRHAASGAGLVDANDIRALATWDPANPGEYELPFMPARVILQDFTGVPCVVDLAAMRDAMAEMGGDPARINPLVP